MPKDYSAGAHKVAQSFTESFAKLCVIYFPFRFSTDDFYIGTELILNWQWCSIKCLYFSSRPIKQNFKNKYRSESIRLRGYDYRLPGWYFVTICTKNRKCFFGEIRNRIVGLSHEGIIAYQNWKKIPDHLNNAILDEYIVMPNHMHGLIGLDVAFNVSTKEIKDFSISEISAKSGSLSSIIRTYKGSVTRDCN